MGNGTVGNASGTRLQYIQDLVQAEMAAWANRPGQPGVTQAQLNAGAEARAAMEKAKQGLQSLGVDINSEQFRKERDAVSRAETFINRAFPSHASLSPSGPESQQLKLTQDLVRAEMTALAYRPGKPGLTQAQLAAGEEARAAMEKAKQGLQSLGVDINSQQFQAQQDAISQAELQLNRAFPANANLGSTGPASERLSLIQDLVRAELALQTALTQGGTDGVILNTQAEVTAFQDAYSARSSVTASLQRLGVDVTSPDFATEKAEIVDRVKTARYHQTIPG